MALGEEETRVIFADEHVWVKLTCRLRVRICRACKVAHENKLYKLADGKISSSIPKCPIKRFQEHRWIIEEDNEFGIFHAICRICNLVHHELRQENVDFDKKIRPIIIKEDYYRRPDKTQINRPLGMEPEEFHVLMEPLCE